MTENFFSSTYKEARQRFADAVSSVSAKHTTYPVIIKNSKPNEYTVDVAAIGPEDAPTLITSCGVHGVEGFLGSAIQLAFLKQLSQKRRFDIRYLFIHGINPYGFQHLRRFNEDNVDLNRNFLTNWHGYQGASSQYKKLNRFLNPQSPPSTLEPFRMKAIWQICCFGMNTVKQSIAGGQYKFPKGIFFGGSGPSQSMKIVEANCDDWIGNSQNILHLDFHSGLGKFGECKLLLAELAGSEESSWYESVFGASILEPTLESGLAFQATGPMGEWLKNHFRNRTYRFITAEYGTYAPLRVLASIRAENRAHHYSSRHSPAYERAKIELLECFCPNSNSWRQQVLQSGLKLIEQSINGLVDSQPSQLSNPRQEKRDSQRTHSRKTPGASTDSISDQP